ncbi:MAG TPA: helix-turn-helix domain-containing protein, partial [Pseudomonadales bacterium]|nr:helix-turn-helix domain-containing protein [Pseudomonadales bacterium]
VSERTLRRRLHEEGIHYRDLLKSVRHEMAQYYLAKTDIRIEKIALQLGYQDTACFRHAFKAQTGKSPREWRDQERAQTLH